MKQDIGAFGMVPVFIGGSPEAEAKILNKQFEKRVEALWEAWDLLNCEAMRLNNEPMFQALRIVEREMEALPGFTTEK
jgi:hypothetical protein